MSKEQRIEEMTEMVFKKTFLPFTACRVIARELVKENYCKHNKINNIQAIIEELSDIRSGYNIFDKTERSKYHALSIAIQVMNEMKGGE